MPLILDAYSKFLFLHLIITYQSSFINYKNEAKFSKRNKRFYGERSF